MKIDYLKKNKFKIFIDISTTYSEIFLNKKKYNYIFKTSDKKSYKFDIRDLVKKIILNNNFKKILINLDLNFYLIVWSADYLFCVVDNISSFQLVYEIENQIIKISDQIKQTEYKKFKKNELIEKLIFNSGYSLGNRTLLDKVKLFMPGEYMVYENNIIKFNNYYKTNFCYSHIKSKDINFLEIINKLFLDLKKKYYSRNIIIPLSAGIDSRFILSTLKYFNFKNIKIFTHYYLNRRDYVVAKEISKYLDYPIEYVSLKPSETKKIYRSNKFNSYLNYKNTGNSINNHGDFISIEKLIQQNYINLETDIIMNGQSGDFITGNHIPQFLFEKEDKNIEHMLEKTLDYIIFKHYNLWSHKKITQDQKLIKNYVKKNYFNNISSKEEIISKYEYFEFENRQVKWVVGQQKVYDFLGLDSYLPLWSIKIVDYFTRNVCVLQRKNQTFYKEFLIKKNFAGVWKSVLINPQEKFNIFFRFFRFLLKAAFYFVGKSQWYDFEKKYLGYFMDNTLISTLYKYSDFIKLRNIPRNTMALMTKNYLKKK